MTVVVNHLKSKGCTDASGGDADQGDGQSCWNPTRVRAAGLVADWLAGNPTGVDGAGVLLIGDMNSYAKEDPIALLEARGYANLAARFIGAGAYSYVFGGETGYLDHALASALLLPRVKAVHEWHINADEPVVLQYTLAYKSAEQQNSFYAPDAYRSSDHDPVVVDLAMADAPPAVDDSAAGPGAAPGSSGGGGADPWLLLALGAGAALAWRARPHRA